MDAILVDFIRRSPERQVWPLGAESTESGERRESPLAVVVCQYDESRTTTNRLRRRMSSKVLLDRSEVFRGFDVGRRQPGGSRRCNRVGQYQRDADRQTGAEKREAVRPRETRPGPRP